MFEARMGRPGGERQGTARETFAYPVVSPKTKCFFVYDGDVNYSNYIKALHKTNK